MCILDVFFFFRQKPAYEMRISDWSSDVCSSDLLRLSARVRLTWLCADRRHGHVLAALLSGDDRATEIAGERRAETRCLCIVPRPGGNRLGRRAILGVVEFLGLPFACRLECIDQPAADAETGGHANDGERPARLAHGPRRRSEAHTPALPSL